MLHVSNRYDIKPPWNWWSKSSSQGFNHSLVVISICIAFCNCNSIWIFLYVFKCFLPITWNTSSPKYHVAEFELHVDLTQNVVLLLLTILSWWLLVGNQEDYLHGQKIFWWPCLSCQSCHKFQSHLLTWVQAIIVERYSFSSPAYYLLFDCPL